jgi:hypothetical protein
LITGEQDIPLFKSDFLTSGKRIPALIISTKSNFVEIDTLHYGK